ncbi:putative spermidine/putrescine transport system substrate-binding protein [Promicromonospora umidemergens]|uniref:ABC transporter substrate-binding protein n=1 Tax=Promicromonospora umidemergens TaxID=629679 RepID=A0ABP8WY99_9MICO|nr:ABC transporter substrate-binding protein [Promicromonospora umidemergens]MCP2285547.1 putative spermidine/putrescine transport system substrate-binding protein [Promicromonospora umidemergens]
MRRTTTRRTRARALGTLATAAAVALSACAAPVSNRTGTADDGYASWEDVAADARGQEVSLWMWGGDEKGNAYVDDVLAPAAADQGVTLRRVPVADTADALNRVVSELQAGQDSDGAVDLVWVNGENFRTGQQAGAWECGWTDLLPNSAYLDPTDPLLAEDFGTPVEGCESPWHKAQFALAYDAADVQHPPTSLTELFDWARAHPGRFTYPAPPDFTGSAFLRQSLYEVTGGPEQVPAGPDDDGAAGATSALWAELADLEPSLWRGGDTYPRDAAALDDLFAGDQVDFTMTYGPATLDARVADGTFPETTRVLTLDDGTLGNASFLAIPANAAHQAGAMVVADLALAPEQQLAKADPAVWGQYPVLELDRVPDDLAEQFADLAPSTVVPPFDELSRGADPELSADWVAPLERGWRDNVLTGQR